jgi:hypothetical protein
MSESIAVLAAGTVEGAAGAVVEAHESTRRYREDDRFVG